MTQVQAQARLQWMESSHGRTVSWTVGKARAAVVYLLQLGFLLLLLCGAGVSWLLHGGGTRRDADAAEGVQADTAGIQKAVEGTPAKASAASDDIRTPQVRLVGVRDLAGGQPGTATEAGSSMAPGKWPEEGVTQYRPVRQEPHSPVHQTATTPLKPATPPPATEVPPLGAAEILLLGLLGCDAGMAAACSGKQSQQQQARLAPDTSPRSPPAAQASMADAPGPTPWTPPPPHPLLTALAARTGDPADEVAAAAADRASHAAEGAAEPLVARNLETALVTASDDTAADDDTQCQGKTGASLVRGQATMRISEPSRSVDGLAGGASSNGELMSAPHQPARLPSEGPDLGEVRTEQLCSSEAHVLAAAHLSAALLHADSQPAAAAPASHAGGASPGFAAQGSGDALQADPEAVFAATAARSTTSAAVKGSKEPLPRQQSGPNRAGGSAGGSGPSTAKGPRAAAVAPGAAGTPVQRMSSDGRYRSAATTAPTITAPTAPCPRRHKEGQGLPAHASGELLAAGAGAAGDAVTPAGTGSVSQAPADATASTPHVPRYLMPTAASTSRRTSQGLGSPHAEGGTHGAASGAPLAQGRSIQLPAAHHQDGAPVSSGSGALSGLRSPGATAAGRGTGTGRTTSLRRVSQPNGSAL